MSTLRKITLSLLIATIFSGCGSKELYTIGNIGHIQPNKENHREFIAIDRIELPIYFMDSPIYKKDTPHHLVKVENANWIHAMDRHLTNVLVAYLQKSMNNPNVYRYPWTTATKMDKRVSLNINKFIAYRGVVSLEANYHILNKKKKRDISYIFNVKIKIESESVGNLINAMEKAYFRLTRDIKEKL
jgi:uncharacterized lipoprotein YmbA